MLLDRFRVDDRVAIVTAGGRGIGAASALALAECGADVVIAARTAEQLDDVAAQVKERGRRAVAVPADLSDLDAVTGLVDTAIAELGRLDIVVNNVGGSMPMPFLDTDVKTFEGAFHFNVSTAYALTQAALPHLLESGHGSVVNITSAMGRFRDRGYVAYGTAKAALAHMTRLLAADCAPKVRVNGVAPGSIATSALEIVVSNEPIHQEMVSKTPLRRLGDPDEIALAVLFLASDAGSYITGKILEVDGGIEASNLDLHLPDL
jgi:7-alpha-hydroxysteroid dehydrogenase